MISAKSINTIEYNKILLSVSEFAVLKETKCKILEFSPISDLSSASELLKKTAEAHTLLYKYSTGGIYYYDDISDELKRVNMGGEMNNGELLKTAANLKSARILKTAIASVHDESLTVLPPLSEALFTASEFEKEIFAKIISENEISDNASPKLASIRRGIHSLNARIRDQLNSFMRGNFSKYLQENVITMRQDRYVIPVKSEYRANVKGFIHDQSSTGATVFIEPEAVMELNNDLKRAMFDEKNEIERILRELTAKVAGISSALTSNNEIIVSIDECFARAAYSFSNKCRQPILNDNGVINVKRGRHPLIDKDKVVPVSVSLGKDYRFLLITGPNTGGKTVSMKLVGLLSLMAMSGLFVPADDDSELSVFNGVYCDIGDEQSIEQSLSTFSSHIKNIKEILEYADEKSLVLIDEIGAGTDPEEGSALALSVIEKLLTKKCCGIITTHYSELKEFAANNSGIENASMEFDSSTLKPLYKLNIGIPGSSNAIDIAKTLGIGEEVIIGALNRIGKEKIGYETVIKKAEEERRLYEKLSAEAEKYKNEKLVELNSIKEEKQKIVVEREKINATAKAETKRIVADKLSEAEEIIDELKSILRNAELESKEVFRASELKNRIKNSRYLDYEADAPFQLVKPEISAIKKGERVFVKSLSSYATILSIKQSKNEAEVAVGSIRTVVKFSDIYNAEEDKNKKATDDKVKIYKKAVNGVPIKEINVIGKTSLEALSDLTDFISQAVMHGLEEIKVIHGVGEGILLKEIRKYLKKDKNVKEYRRGNYGEGENGVTIITLK